MLHMGKGCKVDKSSSNSTGVLSCNLCYVWGICGFRTWNPRLPHCVAIEPCSEKILALQAIAEVQKRMGKVPLLTEKDMQIDKSHYRKAKR